MKKSVIQHNTGKQWDSSTRVERSVSHPKQQVKTNPNDSHGNLSGVELEKEKMPTPVNPGGKINQKQPNSFANRGSTPMGQQVNLPSGGLNNTSLIPESPRLGSNGKRTMAHDFGKEGGRTSVTPTNVMVDKYKDGFELDKALLKTNML